MLRISWRLQRTGLVGMCAFGALYGVIQAAAYSTAAGTTEASRLAFAHQMEVIGPSLSYLLPLPIHVETMAGYLQWRVYGALPLIFVFWCVMSASGATRGDEDRGLVERWLSTGVGRAGYLGSRFLAFLLIAAISVAVTSGAIYLGALAVGSTVPLGPLAEQSIALLGVIGAGYGLALAAAQLPTSRSSAGGLAGAILLLLYLVEGLSRTATSLRPVAALISPFYYYDLNAPLRLGGTFNPLATAGLLVAGLAFAGIAAWLMRLRDIGSPLLRRRQRSAPRVDRPSPNPLLRLPVLAGLYEQRLGILAWAAGSVLAAAFMASLGRQMVTLVNGGGAFGAYLTAAGHGDPYVAITGFFWFSIFELLLAVFAITQVARWSADDNEGRLEMVLSAPVSRSRVVGERALTLLVGTTLIVAIASLGFYASTHAAGINLRFSDLTNASLPLLPFVLSFAAIGALLAARVPRATVAVLASLAFLSYLLTDLGPLLKLPDWATRLSVFSLYGSPLADGIYWTGLWIMVAVTLAGFVLAALLMQRREVGA